MTTAVAYGFLWTACLLPLGRYAAHPLGARSSSPVALTAVKLFDRERGALLPDRTVVVESGRIAAIGPSGVTAEFMLVEGDPLDPALDAGRVAGVLADGRWLSAGDLAQLAEARARALIHDYYQTLDGMGGLPVGPMNAWAEGWKHRTMLPLGIPNSWGGGYRRPGVSSPPRPYVNGGYSFTPDAARFHDPISSTSDDWEVAWSDQYLGSGGERMIPRETWYSLEHQTAVLRREDGLLTLAAARLPVLVPSFDAVRAFLALGRPYGVPENELLQVSPLRGTVADSALAARKARARPLPRTTLGDVRSLSLAGSSGPSGVPVIPRGILAGEHVVAVDAIAAFLPAPGGGVRRYSVWNALGEAVGELMGPAEPEHPRYITFSQVSDNGRPFTASSQLPAGCVAGVEEVVVGSELFTLETAGGVVRAISLDGSAREVYRARARLPVTEEMREQMRARFALSSRQPPPDTVESALQRLGDVGASR